jgi:dolichol-phosphate mannosyltransferase
MAFDRGRLASFGGLAAVADEVVEDVALARHVAAAGGRVAFLDGGDVLTVRMFESFADTLCGWGRSIALPGIEPLDRQLAGLAVVALAQTLPLVRLVTRRADALDLVLLALRGGTLVGTRRAYTTTGPAYWASPLADPIGAFTLAAGIARRRRQTWRGRTYG